MKYNRLTLIKEVEPYIWKNLKQSKFLCQCDCGEFIIVNLNHLKSGNTKSCGCLNKEKRKLPKLIKHQESNKRRTVEYNTWVSMKQRCYNINCKDYKNYGGRGIKICDRWLNSYENFLKDMGRRPIGYSIERLNVNGNYEPINCKWATKLEQNNNRRLNK